MNHSNAPSGATLSGAIWRKSTRSGSGDQCVEVAAISQDRVAVRDSKDPHGAVLTFSAADWRRFVRGAS